MLNSQALAEGWSSPHLTVNTVVEGDPGSEACSDILPAQFHTNAYFSQLQVSEEHHFCPSCVQCQSDGYEAGFEGDPNP